MQTTPSALRWYDDPSAFLDDAREFLTDHPVLVTVISTITERCAAGEVAQGVHPRWWVTAVEDDRVVGVGMRTAPGGASPPYLTDLPEASARELARTLVERGETITQVNGALATALTVAEEIARLGGGSPQVVEHTRLYLLGELREPDAVPGRARPATPADLDVCLAWWEAFEVDAAEQAGRDGSHGPLEPQDAEQMLARIARGRVVLREDEQGEVVHLTGVSPPSFGVVRVGPVYTPAAHRGHGYAGATVAHVSRGLLETGVQVCLFTDQANPVSNKIYTALGFEPLVDMGNVEIR